MMQKCYFFPHISSSPPVPQPVRYSAQQGPGGVMQVRRLSRWLALAAVAVFLMPATSSAQTVNGAVVGTVVDSSGGVVPDVALTIRNIAKDEIVGTTVSEANGSFAFRNLSPANYEAQATKDGFNPMSFPDVEVTLGQQVRLDVTLTPAT